MASYPVTKLDPRGTRVTMLYDAANRLTSRRYPDGRRNTFAYDAVGNEVLMLDLTGRTTTTYSPRGEVSCVAHPGDKRITYSYDALSRRQWMIEPDGGRFTYTHDAAGRLTGLVNPQHQQTSFTFDALARQVTKELANGSITTQAYDDAGRLAGVTNRKSSGDVISSFAYAYDQAGNRTAVLEANGVRTSWSYDKTYQLTHEHRGGHFAFNVTYTYDPVGNRLVEEDSGDRTTYTYDAANQILAEVTVTGRTTYTHDLAGNRTQKEAPAGTTYYTWDEDNRMVAAEPPAGMVTMTYTADGARVEKESPTEIKKFLYDFNNLLAELDADNNTDKLYTQTVEEYGDLVSNYDTDHTDYYHYDGLGSTDALVDDTETLLARHVCRAFGLEQSGGDPNTPFSFVGRQGYYRDDEIDLYLLGAASGGRHYDAGTGRFTCKDRVRDDLNEYRYVRNRVEVVRDPSGLTGEIIIPPEATRDPSVQPLPAPTTETGAPPVCPTAPGGGSWQPATEDTRLPAPDFASETQSRGTRAYWVQKARDVIGFKKGSPTHPKNVLDMNCRITAAYAELYLRDPKRFLWAGMAALASCDVGKAIESARAMRDAAGNPVLGFVTEITGTATGVEIMQALGEGNLAVYADIYWQHLAYSSGGLEVMQELRKRGELLPEAYKAWEMIDHGREWEGNRLLLKYEQEVVLQKSVYDRHEKMFTGIMSWFINSPIPGDDRSFRDCVPGGDLGKFADRWKWIDDSMLPAWRKLVEDDPRRVQKLMEEFLKGRFEK